MIYRIKKMACCTLALVMAMIGLPGNLAGGLTEHLTGRQLVQASVRQVYDSGKKLSKSVSLDLTGDGKKETVSFQATRQSEDTIDRLTVKVNGNKALTLKSMWEAFDIEASYLKISSKEQFLWVKDTCANDDSSVDRIYRYDATEKKLKRVLTLDSQNWKNGSFHVYSSIKAGGGLLKVTYYGQTVATGYITWTYVYQYENNKFTLKSKTANITSQAHEGDFIAAKQITFYKKPGSKTDVFTIEPGDAVELKKIHTYKNTYYLQFQCGEMTGWISADQSDIFEDILLAG